MSMEGILVVLRDLGQASMQDVADHLGYAYKTVWKQMQTLHTNKQVFVIEWERSTDERWCKYRAIWAAGCAKDVLKPRPVPKAHLYRQRDQRKKIEHLAIKRASLGVWGGLL